jgi:hypothetical protein
MSFEWMDDHSKENIEILTKFQLGFFILIEVHLF